MSCSVARAASPVVSSRVREWARRGDGGRRCALASFGQCFSLLAANARLLPCHAACAGVDPLGAPTSAGPFSYHDAPRRILTRIPPLLLRHIVLGPPLWCIVLCTPLSCCGVYMGCREGTRGSRAGTTASNLRDRLPTCSACRTSRTCCGYEGADCCRGIACQAGQNSS